MLKSLQQWFAQARGGKIDWDDIEAALIGADLGLELTQRILGRLQQQVLSSETVRAAAAAELHALWPGPVRRLRAGTPGAPAAWMIVGVNGAGKTTTIGKLAARFQSARAPAHLVAADTFRAAAIEQLGIWAGRTHTGFTAGKPGGDPAAAAHQGFEEARRAGAATVLIDTAGRLHTKDNLMRELEKVKRVLGKLEAAAPQEVLLVVDGTNGGNALAQAREFHRHLGLTGIIATKLDSSARGGALASIKAETGLDPLLLGTGEAAGDLGEFDPPDYVASLLAEGRP